MRRTLRATFSGSSASSQPLGLPVSTAQNRQARVHTAPISMIVAVPAFQHSPIFGHLASSHTVASRCSRTMSWTARKPSPVGALARSHWGFGNREPEAPAFWACALTPSRIAVNPCGVRYFSPLRGVDSWTTGMLLSSDIRLLYPSALMGGLGQLAVQRGQALRGPDVEPQAVVALALEAPGGDGPLEQRQQCESPGLAVREQRRTEDPDTAVGQTRPRTLHDGITFQDKVAGGVLRGIGDHDETRIGECRQTQRTQIDIGEGIPVDHQEGFRPQQRQRLENTPAGFQRRTAFLAVEDPQSEFLPLTQCRADLLP